MLIFERSESGRINSAQRTAALQPLQEIPKAMLRKQRAQLPEISELQGVRHYT
ncbi:MAG: aminomethyl-transferring glycine dehydrogenase subunit GcvPB, partial [Gammaproteobacteria bacterium]|nr:aminomethyl-transferring glycine dehydrogenase subunit GcvPB [Gammaproteobacteria bacterium]